MIKDLVKKVLARFRVSKELGFLLECDLSELPKYYQPWIDLCSSMVQLIEDQSVRRAVSRMPELTTDHLITYEDWRLAHLLLTTITSAYIWSEAVGNETLVIPRNLCAPLMVVSERLGIQPIVCHASVCLANWNLIDSSEPFSPDNLQLNAFIFLESRGNHWFFLVTAQIEKDFAPCIYNIIRAVYLKNETTYQHYLNETMSSIHDCLLRAMTTMKRMPEHLTPAEFYHELRPFLRGYNDSALDHQPIVFEGMEKHGPVKYSGASAAQSSTLQLIDAFLGVEHSGKEKAFLTEQREYMPREHRELIFWVEAETPVQKSTEGRHQALKALNTFRSMHLNTVALFILTQKEKSSKATGTGGTSFMQFLKSVRDDTK
ncbi:Tryptophan 2 3-dioxygenase [Trichostrongylus colubriformis]|uniref:Tryptophan 2 3-dioxygenase n=1 Tax=Trichostrongylus colubriformis TaxID=6319 RepID=A0AAN8J246_TRICO